MEIQKVDVNLLLPNLQRIVSDSNEPEAQVTDFAEVVEDIYVVCHFGAGDLIG